MKHPNEPVPYSTYIYLTRTDLAGDAPQYELRVLLWMPENYDFKALDDKPPAGEPPPPPPKPEEINHYRVILWDKLSEYADSEQFKPITLTIKIDTPPTGKNVLQVFYIIENENPGNVKIIKKPKAKVAYAHADLGGSGPGPQPPATIVVATNT